MNKLLITLPLFLFVTACEINSSLDMYSVSGTLNDNYVAEPFTEFEKKYSNALTTSNKAVDMVKSADYKALYHNLFDEVLKNKVTVDEFIKLNTDISNAIGPVTEYKNMQWAFFPGHADSMKILRTVKIVKYGSKILAYTFVFKNDRIYKKIIGFHVKQMNHSRLTGYST